MALADALKEAEQALNDAKVRAGAIAVLSGRFSVAEQELAELQTAPDQADTVDRTYALTRSLKAVSREQFPAWLLGAGAAAGACIVVGKVGTVDFRKVGLVVLLGSGAVAVGQQTLAKKPSSSDRLKLDENATRMKAEEDRRRMMAERDAKDTKELEDQARKDSEERAKKRAKDAGVFQVSKFPEFSPRPDNAPGYRFGYWKDGKHVDVPLDTVVMFEGKTGRWKQVEQSPDNKQVPKAIFYPEQSA